VRPARRIAAYLLLQAPGWVLVGLIAFVLHAWAGLPGWAAVLVVAVAVAKDVALYPAMREIFRPPRLSGVPLGARGAVVEALAPVGYVRVNGELWRARARAANTVPCGAPIVVRDARGLTLLVDEA